jgi:hypothetical protein
MRIQVADSHGIPGQNLCPTPRRAMSISTITLIGTKRSGSPSSRSRTPARKTTSIEPTSSTFSRVKLLDTSAHSSEDTPRGRPRHIQHPKPERLRSRAPSRAGLEAVTHSTNLGAMDFGEALSRRLEALGVSRR